MTSALLPSNKRSALVNHKLKRGVVHLMFFAGLWWLLTEGDLASWLIGFAAVPTATWLSVILFSSTDKIEERISTSGLLGFIPFFLWQSLRGGLDTARLAVHPNAPVHPGFFRYNTSLPTNSQRLFFLHLVSLLPGTASTKLQGTEILVHVLDMPSFHAKDLQYCENKVARLFTSVLSENPTSKAKEENS